jgi:hypothetical protein
MIGRFKDTDTAEKAKKILDQIEEQVTADIQSDEMDVEGRTNRYSDGMRSLLENVSVHTLAPIELEQFAYDVHVELKGETIAVTTDEVDVSAFLKVLIDNGARVEVYSAHHYPEKEEPKVEAR